MIRVERVPEPADFQSRVRERGSAWIEQHPGNADYPAYWTEFRAELAEGFANRCGYLAMWLPPYQGQVDHFIAKIDDPAKVYEWDNYRYLSPTVNAAKRPSRAWLDPYEVEDDWFEIDFFTLELRLTDKVPERVRPVAEDTLDRLRLRDHSSTIRQREQWYEAYRDGGLSIEWLHSRAPLIARAVEKHSAGA